MSALREAIERRRSPRPKEPGFLDLQASLLALLLISASKIVITVGGKLQRVSNIKTYDSESGELPTRQRTKDESRLTFPKGIIAGVTINGREYLVTHQGKSKRIIVGGKIQQSEKRGSYMEGGSTFALNSNGKKSKRVILGRGVSAFHEPD